MQEVKSVYNFKPSVLLQSNTRFISELKKKLKSGKIHLTKSQRIAVVYHSDLVKRIPRAEVTKHYNFIQKLIPSAMIAGSYRRGEKYSSDIDIVVRQPISMVIDILKQNGYIKDIISQGNNKFSGIVLLPRYKNHRHLDIIFTTSIAYPFTMLYFTGSKKFNIIMRLKAKNKGLRLNEYGLWRGLDVVSGIVTEEDIFKTLGITYIPPEKR
jgi:DNA polymerase (family 10)